MLFFISSVVQLAGPFDQFSTPCKSLAVICEQTPFTFWHCFKFNQFCWFTSYLLGLHFTYLRWGLFEKFTLTAASIKTWNYIYWLAFLSLILAVISGVTWLVILYLRAGVAWFYLAVIIIEVLIIAVPTLALGSSYTLHLHHYSIAMFFVSLLCY